MRAVFLGTPAAAVPSLAALMDVIDVSLVVTRPDTAKGRSGKPAPPPVKQAAAEWGLPVAQPSDGAGLAEAIVTSGADIGIVVAYGRIIDAASLDALRFGFVNVHFSLLPRWRGAAPVERAIAAGDRATGVTLMRLDEGLDTGPVLAAVETPIGPDETGGSLTGRLSYLGAMLIDDALPDYLSGNIEAAPQLRAGVTYARRLERTEGRIEPDAGVVDVERMVRAFNPRPGAWFALEDTRIAEHRATIVDHTGPPGTLTAVNGDAVLTLGDGAIRLDEIQPAGKARMPGSAWMNGRRGVGGLIEPSSS
jgi:methionyl-tRNA formyltransferase